MSKEEKQGGSTLLARIFFPTASALYDTATGKNIWTGNGGMIGGFDDRLAVLNLMRKMKPPDLPTQTTHKQY